MHLANLPDWPLVLLRMQSSNYKVGGWVGKMGDAAKKYQVLYPLLELRFTIACPTFSHHLDTSATRIASSSHLLIAKGHWPCLSRVRELSMSANHSH